MKRVGLVAGVFLLAPLQACGVPGLWAEQEGHGGSVTWSRPITAVTPTEVPAVRGNPFRAREPHVWSESVASWAAEAADPGSTEAEILFRLADVATAVWLLPEAHPSGTVGPFVESVVMEAQSQDTVAVFVVYGIPGRDCIHSYSAGGTTPDEYLDWVREISAAAGRGSVVVLEPDALASQGECALDHDRTALMHEAVGVLADGPVTYVDAGHSRWNSSTTMAARLRSVGVERVRGFSVNVAGYGATAGESSYGHSVAQQLGDAHFVVDVGRAGAGTASTWCNPDGQAVGPLPGAPSEGGALDAELWIKPPGESDGECGGGPAAGEFWTERAVELARAAGW